MRMSVIARRTLLRFLAASPVFAGLGPIAKALAEEGPTLASARDALDIFEIRDAASKVVPPAHWGYLMSGVDGDVTLHANEAAYARYQLRARRMVDVSKVDLGTQLFGTRVDSPILFSPIGSMRSMHAEGEVAVARAAKAKNAVQVVSTQASFSVEQV